MPELLASRVPRSFFVLLCGAQKNFKKMLRCTILRCTMLLVRCSKRPKQSTSTHKNVQTKRAERIYT